MGRKISRKKHRGIKDREKQHIKRLAELELCANIAPRNEDEQVIPKSLERMIKLKEAAKINTNILKKKRKKKNTLICVGQHHKSNHIKTKLEKVVPIFQQRLGESDKQFMHRVSKDTYDFLKEAASEKKYGIQVERDSKTGEIQGLIKCKFEKNTVETLRIEHKNINRKKKILEGISATLFKNERRKLKLCAKRDKKMKTYDEFEMLQDKVIFGEVAYEPPRLKIKSKNINKNRKPKNLLLNLVLEGSKKFFCS